MVFLVQNSDQAMGRSLNTSAPEKNLLKEPKRPRRNFVDSSSICGRCWYNAPQGSHLCLFPGATLLAIGIVLLVWTNLDESWDTMTQHVGIFCAAVGGGFILIGTVYWLVGWIRNQPPAPTTHHLTPRKGTELEPVLVSVINFQGEQIFPKKENQPRQKKKLTAQELALRLQERKKQKTGVKPAVTAAPAAQQQAINNVNRSSGLTNKGFHFEEDAVTSCVTHL